MAIGALPLVLVPLAPTSFPIPFIVIAFVFVEFGVVVYNVSAISLTQALVPERLLGRVNASRRFIVWGTIPLGSLISGALATWIGLRPTLFVGTIGCMLATLPVALSSVRHLKELPMAPEDLPVTEEALLPTQAATLSSEGPGA
jgi:MFS family permease